VGKNCAEEKIKKGQASRNCGGAVVEKEAAKTACGTAKRKPNPRGKLPRTTEKT